MPRAILAALLALTPAACNETPSSLLQGYVEGELVQMAAATAGRLTQLQVNRGDEVTAGMPLFALDDEDELARVHEARTRLARAAAQYEDLTKGQRREEIAVIEAQLRQAQAQAELSRIRRQRADELKTGRFISQDDYDSRKAQHARDLARVAEITAQLDTARLGARSDEQRAAAAEVEATEAQLTQAEWQLAQRRVAAPEAGRVHDTLYWPGEWVTAGAPVVTLLPPGRVKIRFFVGETALGRLQPGDAVKVACDGCGAAFDARVSFISTQAEYTPPVIYSKENRAKLVYLVEARPDPAVAATLHPGQPVDVAFGP